MLRLTVSVVQVMEDARVYVSVFQEDPYDGTSGELGSVTETYDMARRLDSMDELSALLDVLRSWSEDVLRTSHK